MYLGLSTEGAGSGSGSGLRDPGRPQGHGAPFHHRGRGAGRPGLFRDAELYGSAAGVLPAGKGHIGHYAEGVFGKTGAP